ncbi:MAG: DUF1697 domain-containing protein [Actinobacteria bacterium]|nr:DUF1697 domain-containing protein [Actinomycetota bacterium]
MARQIVLLRGINLGPHKRVAMPKLRDALADAGFKDVQTYVQSGNVVVSTRKSPKQTAGTVKRLIDEHFGLDVAVVVRTKGELAGVVKSDPFGSSASNPKLYQVTFFETAPDTKLIRKLDEVAMPKERLAHSGREIYAWHPDGIARSKLAAQLARAGGTARNWTTVTKLLELADS